MLKNEQLKKMCSENGGYLYTSEVMNAGISRTYLIKFAKENHMERVAHGIYLSEDEWQDELFILQKRYDSIIYTGMTALSLHGLTDREYPRIEVAVPASFSGTRLRKENIDVYRLKPEWYTLGVTNVKTIFGNTVRAYDRERCICNAILYRKRMEVQHFQTALKEYMSSSDKSLTRLIEYAEKMDMRDEVMKYVEVMV